MGIVAALGRTISAWLNQDRAPYPLSDEEWQAAQAQDRQQLAMLKPPAPALGLEPTPDGWAVPAPAGAVAAGQMESKRLPKAKFVKRQSTADNHPAINEPGS